MSGLLSFLAGQSAEVSAERYYESKGMKVQARRWRCRGGEIDLVLQDGDSLIFVEVKKSKTFAKALESLVRSQMNRIFSAASLYLVNAPLGDLTPCRFDVAAVDGAGNIKIIENAFDGAW